MSRPASQRPTAAKPSSAPRLRAVKPDPTPADDQAGDLHALVAALLAFVASWRPRLTDPVALVVLRGIEAMLGAVSGLVDDPGRRLDVAAGGPVVGVRLTPESKRWPDALPAHELRDFVAERLLLAMEDLSETAEYVDEMTSDASAEVFGPQSVNVTRYADDLRRCLRGFQTSFSEMSAALVGTCISHSLATHVRNLTNYVDGGER